MKKQTFTREELKAMDIAINCFFDTDEKPDCIKEDLKKAQKKILHGLYPLFIAP